MAHFLVWMWIKLFLWWWSDSHLQSGAGHQRVSGSAARKRLNWYSSNRSSSARSSRMARTSSGASVSGHCGQAMPTRLSEISMRRYWRRQSEHVRWEQEVSRGKWQRGWLSRHSGHSSRCSSKSCSWLEEERDRTPVEPLLTPPTHSAVAAPPSPTSAAAGRPPPSPLSPPETLESPASSAVMLRSCERLQRCWFSKSNHGLILFFILNGCKCNILTFLVKICIF